MPTPKHRCPPNTKHPRHIYIRPGAGTSPRATSLLTTFSYTPAPQPTRHPTTQPPPPSSRRPAPTTHKQMGGGTPQATSNCSRVAFGDSYCLVCGVFGVWLCGWCGCVSWEQHKGACSRRRASFPPPFVISTDLVAVVWFVRVVSRSSLDSPPLTQRLHSLLPRPPHYDLSHTSAWTIPPGA